MRQEQRSLRQLKEAWEEWNPGRFENDIGIDLTFDICDDGHPAGLTFHVQAKSVTDIEARTTDGELKYRLEVNHLRRWENYQPPVVVVIWDVNSKTGVWQDVPTILALLKHTRPNWRAQATLTIPFPKSQTCTKSGKVLLRRRIGSLALPALLRENELDVTLTFSFPPDDDESQGKRAELRSAYEDGSLAVIPCQFVERIEFPEWYTRVMGPACIANLSKVEIRAMPGERTVPLELRAVSATRNIAIPIACRMASGGHRRQFWSNEHEPDRALTLSFVVETDATTVDIRTQFSFPTATRKSLEILVPFLLAAREGATLTLNGPSSRELGRLDLQALVGSLPKESQLLCWETALQRLAFIQTKIVPYGTFDYGAFDSTSFALIDEVYNMYTGGSRSIETHLRVTLNKPWETSPLQKAREKWPPTFEIRAPRKGVKLLGVAIPVRQCSMTLLEPDNLIKACEAYDRARGTEFMIATSKWAYRLVEDSLASPKKQKVSKRDQTPGFGKQHWGR